VKIRPTLLLLCTLLAAGAPAAAGEHAARLLRFNPFARPDLGGQGQPDAQPAAGEGWAPVLTAALADGEDSLANLGGVILEIGEETHGYRLVRVDVFEATFEKDGTTLVLPVEPRERAGRP